MSRTPRIAARLAACAVALGAAAAPAHASTTADAQLAGAVDRYSRALGVERSSLAAIDRANLPGAVAGALADELSQLYRCQAITRSELPWLTDLLEAGFPEGVPPVTPATRQRGGDTILGIPIAELPNPQLPANFPFEDEVRACGEESVRRLDAVRTALVGRDLPSTAALNLWPVLRFAPGDGGHTYVHDYVLLIEMGGNNRYFNNAGGSSIDVWRGPKGSPAGLVAPARGCIDAFDIARSRTCTLTSGALLSMRGGNQYGRLEAPDPLTDGRCTNDPVMRRVFVQASGILGVGIVLDEGSDNTFTGKVLTTGVGHLGGYGYLRVRGDRNRFEIIRSGLGAAIVGGIGTLDARGDDNVFTYRVPAPKDPAAAPGTPGSGGVVNDLNGCDNGASVLLGSGSVGGVGVFRATGIGASYTAPADSLGSGIVLGKGTFTQTGGGVEAYAGPGAAGRGNDLTIAATWSNDGTFTDG